MIYDFSNDIGSRLTREGMDVCIICYGGCCSNTMVDHLEKNGFHCRTYLWDKIVCHCPEVIDTREIPIIYLYRDPVEAFLSMKRRSDIWITNQKKLNNDMYCHLSDENLLRSMLRQFTMWTEYAKKNPDKVLVLYYPQLFQEGIQNILQTFLKRTKKLDHFPIEYKPPHQYTFTETEQLLFEKYKREIDSILYYHLR